ncbi:Uncharacterized protein FWK35_00006119 [Aphis craccivora]|uniref:DDE 3 domain-containing protein n=1 Tax=Aphis craccivora TaxID=307492 RepID=A0A6G0YRS3_APHCR|nr:Uncharacterized protein FWK35_00006119 [Aphis craccivora]
MSFVDKDTHSQSKKKLFIVYIFLKQLSEKSDLTADFFKSAQVITVQACGISHRTVKRICAEARKSDDPETPDASPTFISPRKGYTRAKTVSELDDFDSDIARRTVYEFYDRGEYPTAQLILNAKCNDGRLFLMERNDIVALRCKFLRQMSMLREKKDDRPVVYLNETWVNQNHSRTLIWQNEHNSMGLKVPTGKGGRLIVCHAGCARYGFIEGSKLVFRSNSGNTMDYPDQMNGEVFKQWFIKLLNNLEDPSVIVMDNAPYHSTFKETYPKNNWRRLTMLFLAVVDREMQDAKVLISLFISFQVKKILEENG